MRKLFAIAAFLLASSAAQAQYTFEYGGRTIRIDPDRGTVSIPGVYDNTGRRNKRSNNDRTATVARKQAPDAGEDRSAGSAAPRGRPVPRRDGCPGCACAAPNTAPRMSRRRIRSHPAPGWRSARKL